MKVTQTLISYRWEWHIKKLCIPKRIFAWALAETKGTTTPASSVCIQLQHQHLKQQHSFITGAGAGAVWVPWSIYSLRTTLHVNIHFQIREKVQSLLDLLADHHPPRRRSTMTRNNCLLLCLC
uniref:Uncharacterized protein n=1 Tax=Triticum urartu TaxID=4572 RepID=A0A8R7VEY7_TRIUA